MLLTTQIAKDGDTALILAAHKYHTASFTSLEKLTLYKEIIKLLFNAGADSNIKNKKNETVLSCLKNKADDIVQLIKNR